MPVSAMPSHLDAIADGGAATDPRSSLVTHAHSDHVTGAPAIHARWPQAIFIEVSVADRAIRMCRWTWLEDGSIVETDEGPLTVLHTPGHAPDHLTFWHADSRTLFVGDMLVQGSTVVIPASHGGSLALYLRSLERMLQLNPARALPAHGPVIDDPAALIHHYVEHRAQREGQVLDAIAAGAVDRRRHHREDLSHARRARWCRWRARACSRICRSSKSEGRARHGSLTVDR